MSTTTQRTKERILKTRFWNGDLVYRLGAREKNPGHVTTVTFEYGGSVLYNVSWGNGDDSAHYDIELSFEYEPDYI